MRLHRRLQIARHQSRCSVTTLLGRLFRSDFGLKLGDDVDEKSLIISGDVR